MMAGTSLKAITLVLSVSLIVASHLFCSQQWKMVSAGSYTLGLMANGSLYAWGENVIGKVEFRPDPRVYLEPFMVMPEETFKFVVAKYSSSYAITTDGRLFFWGPYEDPRISPLTGKSPSQIGKDTDWMMIVPGAEHTLALKLDGSLYAWGKGRAGQLGTGEDKDVSSPVRIMSNTSWKCISAGVDTSFAIRIDGALFAWGASMYGGLGDGSNRNQLTPVRIGGPMTYFSMVSTSGQHTLAVDVLGNLYTWGKNKYGEIGVPPPPKESKFPTIPDLLSKSKWEFVSAGMFFSLAMKTDGTLWGFGQNTNQQLGDKDKIQISRLVTILPGQTWKSVSAGSSHAFGITSEGHIIGWGSNNHGQLGNGKQERDQGSTPERCSTKGFSMSKLVQSIKKMVNTR